MERRLAAILAADMVGYSRLMEADEEAILVRQKRHRVELIDPEIARNRGRIVKTTGDGMLAEFASAQDAVRCAIDIQENMQRREADSDPDHRIQYRVGVNIGDVIFEDGDIFGDGVNVAARLEALAEPGSVCISDIVHQTVLDRLGGYFRDMGQQRVKNLSRPIRVWQWQSEAPATVDIHDTAHSQRVRYATSADGVQIAWADVGRGVPVLKAPNWMTHLEYEWGNPMWSGFLERFTDEVRLVRFDQRGNGLSDWEVPEISEAAMLADMEAVVAAAGLERFALFGASQGAGFSVRYALAHPDQVSCIVIWGGYVRGRLARKTQEQTMLYETACRMIRDGWGATNPIFRQFFTSSFAPEVGPDLQKAFDELQRVSVSPDNALRIFEMNGLMDVSEDAKKLTVPVLVLHAVGDRVAPASEGRLIARLIDGAEYVELPGENHFIVEGTPTFDSMCDEALAFIAKHS
ncbi:alpha/beta fold hydrolase [Shimia sp.]|uniref:alpha/beta fold hydrolase n=1 Tax=Shimia sp. TaxID=1954381 RepID=UPI003297C109